MSLLIISIQEQVTMVHVCSTQYNCHCCIKILEKNNIKIKFKLVQPNDLRKLCLVSICRLEATVLIRRMHLTKPIRVNACVLSFVHPKKVACCFVVSNQDQKVYVSQNKLEPGG